MHRDRKRSEGTQAVPPEVFARVEEMGWKMNRALLRLFLPQLAILGVWLALVVWDQSGERGLLPALLWTGVGLGFGALIIPGALLCVRVEALVKKWRGRKPDRRPEGEPLSGRPGGDNP